jgi:cephalosporin hydroxylase
MNSIQVNFESNEVILVTDEGKKELYSIGTPEAFNLLSKTWLRLGWDTKYVYSFSWMGRPIIQLPEDIIRIQEVIYAIKPDVIIETGIAHGGSLILYASLLSAMGNGRVIGVDVEIRPHNREAIESHEMYDRIVLIEGSSIEPDTLDSVKQNIKTGESTLIILDSNHTKSHVLEELRGYSELVSIGSYIIATDGIMKDLVGAPRSNSDWIVNNPQAAVDQFLKEKENFILEEPVFPFNEGEITQRVTYWPNAFLRRVY